MSELSSAAKKTLPGPREPARIPCPCCGKSQVDEYEICPVCGWENDPIAAAHPDSVLGANSMTLSEARQAVRRGGNAW